MNKTLTYIVIFLCLLSCTIANRLALHDLQDQIKANDIEIKALREKMSPKPNLILPAGYRWLAPTQMAKL